MIQRRHGMPLDARERLAAEAPEEPVGADGYWALPA